MMKSIRRLAMFLVLPVLFAACGESGGNAGGGGGGSGAGDVTAIVGKSVVITPSSGGDSFSNVFIDADTVAVTKSNSAALVVDGAKEAVIDTQTVGYTASGSSINYEATFADGTNIVVSLTIGADGSVSSGSIKVDGVTVTASFVVSTPSNAGTAADALAAGLTALTSRDLVAAKNAYCNELPDSPANSQLAFGCFWSKLMLLPTTSEAGALLNTFGEPVFNPSVNYYGTDGIFTRIDDVFADSYHPLIFNYGDFNLPFANYAPLAGNRWYQLMIDAVSHGVSSEEFLIMLADLKPHFSELEALLAIVLSDPAFSFSLPKELFNVAADVPVTLNDAKLFQAGVAASIAALTIIDAYDYGVDITKVVQAGAVNEDILLEDLNGTGATVGSVTVDTVAFLTLADAAKVASAKARLLTAVDLTKTALEKLNSGATSAFFSPIFDDPDLSSIELPPAITTLGQIRTSLTSGSVALTEYGTSLNLDLRAFFNTPPSATTTPVSAGDPFVMEPAGIRAVENYFREFLSGVATF